MIHSREPMSIEQLATIIRNYEEPFCREGQLIGSIITCPLCGNKAVIVPLGMSLENNLPCHCIIGQHTGNIYEYHCTKSKLTSDLVINEERFFINSNRLDISNRFKWFSENGYIF